jgi:hypothetical protein
MIVIYSVTDVKDSFHPSNTGINLRNTVINFNLSPGGMICSNPQVELESNCQQNIEQSLIISELYPNFIFETFINDYLDYLYNSSRNGKFAVILWQTNF